MLGVTLSQCVCVCPPHISVGGELVNALYVFGALYSELIKAI